MSSKIKHVAVIMDGNGRWANSRSHKRVWGHIRGSSIVSNIVEEADDLGLKALTLYAFSTENWSRPLNEVSTLFSLLKKFLIKEKERIIRNKIRFKVMGNISNLPEETKDLINTLETMTKDQTGLKLTFAFDYGGRTEIVSAVNKLIKEANGKDITIGDIESNLYVPDLGEVDLLIRTGGDQRISNFLLWQTAYAELYFTQSKWPDFSRREFRQIITDVETRERRFGAVDEQDSLGETISLAQKNKELLNQNLRS